MTTTRQPLHRVQTGTGLREHLEDPDDRTSTLCGARAYDVLSLDLPECAVCRMSANARGFTLPRTWDVQERPCGTA